MFCHYPPSVRKAVIKSAAIAATLEGFQAAIKSATSADPMPDVVKDLKKLVKAGAKTLKAEVAAELKKKNSEERKLEKTVEVLTTLSEKSEKAFPAEISYSHTARDITQGFFTKTEEVVLEDVSQTKETLATVEKSLNRWGKLRVQMHEELQQTDKRLKVLVSDLEPFVISSRRLIDELLLTFA